MKHPAILFGCFYFIKFIHRSFKRSFINIDPMNIKTLMAITLMICSFNGNAQKLKLKKQKDFNYHQAEYLDTIGFKKPDFKQIAVELRIWHKDLESGQTKMIRLLKDKKEHWSAKSLDYYCFNESNCFLDKFIIEEYKLSENWDKTWKNIVENDYLNIKDQNDVNATIQIPGGELLFAADGDGFIFEIITRRKKRSFSYFNIESFAEFYKEFGVVSKECEKAFKFIQIIQKEFDWTKKAQKHH